MSEHIYIPSTAPGKTWSLYAGKNRAGFVMGSAIEGEYTKEPGRMTSFSYTVFEARQVNVTTEHKRATAKAEAAAIEAVKALLRHEGKIAAVTP